MKQNYTNILFFWMTNVWFDILKLSKRSVEKVAHLLKQIKIF